MDVVDDGESAVSQASITDYDAISLRGYLLATTGWVGEAREALRRLEAMSREQYLPPYPIALVHAGLGDREGAFEWLDKPMPFAMCT